MPWFGPAPAGRLLSVCGSGLRIRLWIDCEADATVALTYCLVSFASSHKDTDKKPEIGGKVKRMLRDENQIQREAVAWPTKPCWRLFDDDHVADDDDDDDDDDDNHYDKSFTTDS